MHSMVGEVPFSTRDPFLIRHMWANPYCMLERLFADGRYLLRMAVVNASVRLGELESIVMKRIGW